MRLLRRQRRKSEGELFGKTTAHTLEVIRGVKTLIEKNALRIDGVNVYLYEEFWGANREKGPAWMKNIYLYLRLEKNYTEKQVLFFYNIETEMEIGYWDGEKAYLV